MLVNGFYVIKLLLMNAALLKSFECFVSSAYTNKIILCRKKILKKVFKYHYVCNEKTSLNSNNSNAAI